MAHVYEKQTRETVDFPAYTLTFLGVLLDKLEFYGLIDGKPSKINTDAPSTLVVPIVSKKFKYCWDGIELIQKTLKRRGFNCKMEKYSVVDVDEKDGTKSEGYRYQYKLSKV